MSYDGPCLHRTLQMPALQISIDGNEVATVSTDGYDVINARISGTLIDHDLATLGLSGTSQPEDGESVYRTWVNEIPLKAGQVIAVSLLESAANSHEGKTIEELYPEGDLGEAMDFTVTAEMAAELRARSKYRQKYSFRVRSSSGASFAGESSLDEHGFTFSVVWNSFHPERAHVSLHSFTLQALEGRGAPLKYLFEEQVYPVSTVSLELVA